MLKCLVQWQNAFICNPAPPGFEAIKNSADTVNKTGIMNGFKGNFPFITIKMPSSVSFS